MYQKYERKKIKMLDYNMYLSICFIMANKLFPPVMRFEFHEICIADSQNMNKKKCHSLTTVGNS